MVNVMESTSKQRRTTSNQANKGKIFCESRSTNVEDAKKVRVAASMEILEF
jgi:hypothetical protein